MASGEPCGVCGETEMKLVDGYYYCAECGTQDTNLQETIVEHTALADGTFGVARRTRYSVKIKEGVEMPPEWYKWHRHNFLLAGLTEQLIELGAAPSVRMKVLWIWTRYIKRYQKKGEMGPSQALNQLQESSSSSSDEQEKEEAEDKEEELVAILRKGSWALNRVSSYVALTILALALNIDRSSIFLSHVTRFARFRLLTVTDLIRFVPAEIYEKSRRVGYSPVRVFLAIPYLMSQLAKHLDLGPPVIPDIEQMLLSQLRELRLPRGLGQLVRALMQLAPVPFNTKRQANDEWRFPDYEATVMAYIVVALKMCFGLDDDYERRLSDAVDRVNEDSDRSRAYSSDPEPTSRLFSFRAWAAHVQLRARLLTRHYAPFAWTRDAGGDHVAALVHFREFTSARAADDDPRPKGRRKGATARVTDQVTMEILNRIPNRFQVGVLSLHELKSAAAAREPQVAVARAVSPLLPAHQRRLLDEDFTQYCLEYAYRHLALPDSRSGDLFRGVRRHHTCRRKLGDDIYASHGDHTIVYIKNCSNTNWASTGRPTAAHVVRDDDDAGVHSTETRGEEETDLETFDEEKEGTNIYDDDFADIQIKEEKTDSKDDAELNETKVEADRIDDFESAGRGSVDNKSDDELRDIFDSDEEAAPPFDPRTFDRKGVIKEIMAASYKKLSVPPPVRFQTEKTVAKKDPKRLPVQRHSRDYLYGVGTQVWVNRQKQKDSRANVEDIIAIYRDNLHRDVLYQVQERVRAVVHDDDDHDGDDDHDDRRPPEPHPADVTPQPGDASHADATDADGDVEIIENDGKNYENIEDEFDEHAYDPIIKSDAKFDEKTHDVHQLYLKMTEPPSEPPSEPRRDESSDDVTAIIDERIHGRKKRARKPEREPKVMKTDIDHLVDAPERIRGYNYWVAKVAKCADHEGKHRRRLERDMKERCPRSFWFVLRECAAALGLSPAQLYRRVAHLEDVLLQLLPAPRATAPARNRGRPRKHDHDLVGGSVSQNMSERPQPGSYSDSTYREGGTALRNREPRKRGRPRKYDYALFDLSLPKKKSTARGVPDSWKKPEDGGTLRHQQNRNKTERPRKNVNLSESSECRRESTSESSGSSSDSSPERPRKRGRLRESFDGNLSVAGDSRKPESRLREDKRTVHGQQNQRKRGSPRKNFVRDLSRESDSQESTARSLSSYSDSSEEDETALRKPERPRKRGEPRKYMDGNLSTASDSQKKPDDGSTLHSQQNQREIRRLHKNVAGDLSELSDSQESTPSSSTESD